MRKENKREEEREVGSTCCRRVRNKGQGEKERQKLRILGQILACIEIDEKERGRGLLFIFSCDKRCDDHSLSAIPHYQHYHITSPCVLPSPAHQHAASRSVTTQHHAASRSITQHHAARSTTQHHAAHAASRSITQHYTTPAKHYLVFWYRT